MAEEFKFRPSKPQHATGESWIAIPLLFPRKLIFFDNFGLASLFRWHSLAWEVGLEGKYPQRMKTLGMEPFMLTAPVSHRHFWFGESALGFWALSLCLSSLTWSGTQVNASLFLFKSSSFLISTCLFIWQKCTEFWYNYFGILESKN